MPWGSFPIPTHTIGAECLVGPTWSSIELVDTVDIGRGRGAKINGLVTMEDPVDECIDTVMHAPAIPGFGSTTQSHSAAMPEFESLPSVS